MILRQGWERLCAGGAPQACRGGGATSGEPRPPRMQGKSGPAAHLSGQPDGAWRCSKHKTFTPSLVLFADNGIAHPRHSYGYAFGLPALFSTKITSTYPTFMLAATREERPA